MAGLSGNAGLVESPFGDQDADYNFSIELCWLSTLHNYVAHRTDGRTAAQRGDSLGSDLVFGLGDEFNDQDD